MASVPISQMCEPRAGSPLLDCVDAHGSRSHLYPASGLLREGPAAARNLADAIHMLCVLHGQYPSLIELVADRSVDPRGRAWLTEAAEGFSSERAFLARLAVAAGPIPATPGGGSEAAIAAQRHALGTLARSERRGCALGAALAFAADWAVIRSVLEIAAERFALLPPPRWSGDRSAIGQVAEDAAGEAPVGRALLFGAEQVALQHRGLWDLLEARAHARAAS